MKITKITIHSFRSIESEIIIPSQFNIFVGQNNHGKTNLFESVEWFFNKKKDDLISNIRYGRTGNEDVSVEIEFSGAQDGLMKMKSATARTKIERIIGTKDTVIIRRIANESSNRRVIIVNDEEKDSGVGFDNALNDFLPKFEYVDTKKYYEELAKFGRTATPISSMLSGVLETLLEGNEEYNKFRQTFEKLFKEDSSQIKVELNKISGEIKIYLGKQFPDCVKVEFTIGEPSFMELLKNFGITIHDGIETNADEKGDGMQRALMLAIIQTYADYRRKTDDIGKTFLFFIDEAELHLHPTAQRYLKNALYELSEKGDQIFINTHSSVFVADELPNQTILCVEKIDNKTTAKNISPQEKPSVVYDLLGGSPADLLLPHNFLIVEGKSDEEFLKMVISRFYNTKPVIQIIFAGGDLGQQADSMEAVNTAYIPIGQTPPIYKDRLTLMCDKPKDQRKENDKTEFFKAYSHLNTQNQHFELPVDAIEKYYPDPWKKNDTEIKALDQQMNGKLLYAREVASKVSQQQFETDMKVAFDALSRCWELAY